MKWQINYCNEKLEEEILNFPDGLLARYLRLTDLMIEFGANLGLPHTKPLDKGLFELRINCHDASVTTKDETVELSRILGGD